MCKINKLDGELMLAHLQYIRFINIAIAIGCTLDVSILHLQYTS